MELSGWTSRRVRSAPGGWLGLWTRGGRQVHLDGIHHGGIVVRNLDRSLYFYHDILGLPFANEPTPWDSSSELERGVRVSGACVRQASLWVGARTTLELIEHAHPAANGE